jgi:hypothetical protein
LMMASLNRLKNSISFRTAKKRDDVTMPKKAWWRHHAEKSVMSSSCRIGQFDNTSPILPFLSSSFWTSSLKKSLNDGRKNSWKRISDFLKF